MIEMSLIPDYAPTISIKNIFLYDFLKFRSNSSVVHKQTTVWILSTTSCLKSINLFSFTQQYATQQHRYDRELRLQT